jgi:hypothetical protein
MPAVAFASLLPQTDSAADAAGTGDEPFPAIPMCSYGCETPPGDWQDVGRSLAGPVQLPLPR